MAIQWMPIDEADGVFEVSSDGRVRRAIPGPRNKPLIEIKAQKTNAGYWRVCLRCGGKTIIRFVHRLVAIAFLGPVPPLMQVNHIDGDKNNNSISNLEYVTAQQNKAHATMMGLNPSGDMHYSRVSPEKRPRGIVVSKKFGEQDIRDIRVLRDAGMSLKEIAAIYNTTPSTVSKIQRKQLWGHVA